MCHFGFVLQPFFVIFLKNRVKMPMNDELKNATYMEMKLADIQALTAEASVTGLPFAHYHACVSLDQLPRKTFRSLYRHQ